MKIKEVSLENFKAVNTIKLDKLEPVNILVGPQNAGKTSILEAIYFLFNHQRLSEARDFLKFFSQNKNIDDDFFAVRVIFEARSFTLSKILNPKDGDSFKKSKYNIKNYHDQKNKKDIVECRAVVEINSNGVGVVKHEAKVNGQVCKKKQVENLFYFFRERIKFFTSFHGMATKRLYYSANKETKIQRKKRLIESLQELSLQKENYQNFLIATKKLFPHIEFGQEPKKDIVEFFGSGFIGTIKVLMYLFNKNYSVVLIDDPEIYFYPGLTRKFFSVLLKSTKDYKKQVFIASNSPLLLSQRHFSNFYHISRSQENITSVRKIDRAVALSDLSYTGASPSDILQADMILYVEGPYDIGVFSEFIRKFPELEHLNISIQQLGGDSMGNVNVDPARMKENNPFSFAVVDSERRKAGGTIDDSHYRFYQKCKKVGMYCLVLRKRAIENYFTANALKKTYGHRIKKRFYVKPYAYLDRQIRFYEKADSRRIASYMTKKEILNQPDLRELFNNLIEAGKKFL